MEKNFSYNAWFSYFIWDMIIFDLWLLMKVRSIYKFAIQLFWPVIKVSFYATLTTGIFLGIILSSGLMRSSDYNGLNSLVIQQEQPSNSPENSFASLQKGIVNLKNQALQLEEMLRKTNKKLSNLNLYHKLKSDLLADFASEAAGASIISTPDTQAYFEEKNTRSTFFGFPIWKPHYHTSRKIIQPWTQAGECWAFKGSHGKIEISLAHAVKINQVTLEHISVISSHTGNINSAPKVFTIFGYFQGEYVELDSFTYDINRTQSSQTFEIRSEEKREIPVEKVLLEIISNWGHPKYTCIYRFKVHGQICQLAKDEVF